MSMESVAEKTKHIFDNLKETFGYTNPMQTPRIDKVVVSVGVGSVKDEKRREYIQEHLARITGQKPAVAPARKSVASFKVRAGDIAGFKVTLRGERMYAFLDKLIHIALPRTRDFRGLNPGSIDEVGNYTIGLREHTVFPESADEDIRDVFGLAVTISTTAKTKEEAEALLRALGLPLKAREDQ